MTQSKEKWITTEEAAEILGVTRVRIQHIIQRGKRLVAKKFGWAWMIDYNSVIYLRDHPHPAGNPNWKQKKAG